jgi:hypothetical protein
VLGAKVVLFFMASKNEAISQRRVPEHCPLPTAASERQAWRQTVACGLLPFPAAKYGRSCRDSQSPTIGLRNRAQSLYSPTREATARCPPRAFSIRGIAVRSSWGGGELARDLQDLEKVGDVA